MNYKEYIASGIIEEYCLGMLKDDDRMAVEHYAQLSPEVKQEIEIFSETLEQYALDSAIDPGKHIKNETLQILHNLNLEQKTNIDELPLLNKYSDYKNWLKVVKPLLPERLKDPMFVCEMRHNNNDISQLLIWTAVDYPDEVHENVEECFIILEGKCRCYIEDRIIELGPGGYLEIPMFKHHNVMVLEPVLAVVQRIKVA